MRNITFDTTAPVLVTGASGYVAGWIVKRLLEAGATVHATVRDPDNTAKTAPLQALADASPGHIRLFKADLLDPDAFADAMQDCGVVFHTASPFTVNVKDPQKDLIDPAVRGTAHVLNEATRTPTVTRVVLTSSCAAMYADAADCANAPGGVLTEAIWNTTASLAYQPYSLSKTLAEKEAWKIAQAQSQWRLVVVNPSLVLGPAIHGVPTSESFRIIKQLGDGTLRVGAPRFSFGVVDVRDLADAHVTAGFLPDAEGRHIISAHETDLLEVSRAIRPRFGGDYPVPHRTLPRWLVWLIGPSRGLSRRYVSRNVGVPWQADNAKSRQVLGMTYRPLAETAQDMFAQMIESGAFAKR